MTREAKIGLLVALAFVLVIGILLSDHVTTSTREPGAPLALVEQSIRDGITTPGGKTPPVLPQQQEADQNTEATIRPVTASASAADDNMPFIFPPSMASDSGVQIQMHTPPSVPQDLVPDAGINTAPQWENDEPVATDDEDSASATAQAPDGASAEDDEAADSSDTSGRQTISDLARQAGEELVSADGRSGTSAASQETPVKDYTVQKGDSLSKITAKFLGRDNAANRDLLLSLNPDLRKNPDMIQVGDVYKVPADTQAAAALRGGTPSDSTTSEASPETSSEAKVVESKPAGKGRTYTVKSGDSLWAIAESQLGNGARMQEILKLNKDQISNADAIAEGMVLKLPA